MRPKPLLGILAICIVLALIIYQVGRAIKHTFTGRSDVALLDRSTPDEQNGLTLLEIDNVSPKRSYKYTDKGTQDDGGASLFTAADTGLWIRMPDGHFLPPNCPDSKNSGCEKALSIIARTSTGYSFPLNWRVTDFQGKGEILLASIPAGYPDTIRWMDVSFDDRIGHKAIWRITHLPLMQHIIVPTVTPRTVVHSGKITAQAAVFREEAPSTQGEHDLMKWDFKALIAGPTHQWELGTISFDTEWEPPDTITFDTGGTIGSVAAGSGVKFEMSPQYLYDSRTDTDNWPYLSEMHWVRMNALLKEFDTYEETVTFHNVSIVRTKSGARYLTTPKNQILKTPSGITLQMKAAPSSIPPGEDISQVGVRFLCPQAENETSLPQSPLWQHYKRPIMITLGSPCHKGFISEMPGDSEPIYQFPFVPVSGKRSDTFTVIVRQRVDLHGVVLRFTLPVLDKKPATFP